MAGAVLGDEKQPQPQRIEVRQLYRMIENHEAFVLIDVASYLECMDSRIPGSLCLPCDEGKGETDFSGTRKDAKLVFYGGNVAVDQDCPVIREAVRQGYTKINILKGGLPAWRRAGYDAESIQRIRRSANPSVKAKDLGAWLKHAGNPLILDIRSPEAFKKEHMENAMNISMSVLHLRYQDIPLDRKILIVDDDGSVSFLAASYLFRKGFTNTSRLVGGMAAWNAMRKGMSK
ncbi:MAG: rhodanese-like domain-containing protein [Syntrophales bacterium]|nr:rhodanese-like domain-containing protein [Syntrophales bacterium]